MERIIRIDGFTQKEKQDKTGTFPCFECLINNKKTSVGVFEKDVEVALKSHMDEWVKVVAPKRANGYINITHFVERAKKEEIPNFTEEAKESDAEQITKPTTSKVPSEITTRIMHELVDNRIVYNKYEFGAANDRHTIKYEKGNGKDFEDQYRDICKRRQIVDAEINPKQ